VPPRFATAPVPAASALRRRRRPDLGSRTGASAAPPDDAATAEPGFRRRPRRGRRAPRAVADGPGEGSLPGPTPRPADARRTAAVPSPDAGAGFLAGPAGSRKPLRGPPRAPSAGGRAGLTVAVVAAACCGVRSVLTLVVPSVGPGYSVVSAAMSGASSAVQEELFLRGQIGARRGVCVRFLLQHPEARVRHDVSQFVPRITRHPDSMTKERDR